jgi:hypothetical protein
MQWMEETKNQSRKEEWLMYTKLSSVRYEEIKKEGQPQHSEAG